MFWNYNIYIHRSMMDKLLNHEYDENPSVHALARVIHTDRHI
jgi:hypothetical protein